MRYVSDTVKPWLLVFALLWSLVVESTAVPPNDRPTRRDVEEAVAGLSVASSANELLISRQILAHAVRATDVESTNTAKWRSTTAREFAAILTIGQSGSADDLQLLLPYIRCRLQNERVKNAPLIDIPVVVGITRKGGRSTRRTYLACQAIAQLLGRDESAFDVLLTIAKKAYVSDDTRLRLLSILVHMKHTRTEEFTRLLGTSESLLHVKKAVLAGEKGYWLSESLDVDTR